jgi:FkbM family methyltransferase
LKKGQTFYDVGAQVGYFSKLASDLGAKVIAFEPCKNNGVYLQENCPDINIIDVALSDFNGQTRLFTGKTPGENSLLENYHNGCGSELVMANRFDDLLLDIPDMIKMDIEGGERKALLGMESIITTNKPITLIFEDWDNKNTDWLVDTYGWNLVTTDRASGNRILTKNMDYEYVEEPIRCHLLGTFNAPNTLRDEGIGNAFGTKVINMAKILRKLGHYIIFYGIEGSDVECDEFVQVSTMDVLRQTYGEWDNTKIYSEKYDDFSHKTFNENCIREINARKRNGDFLLLCHGTFHKQIADAVQIPETIEIGIGHRSSFARFRVFESQMQMNWTYGKEDKGDGNFYDCVIPGFFDPDDFEYSEDKEDYFLYLGRVITKKGIFVAQQVCQVLGKKLVVAGFGYTKEANETDYNSFKSLLEMPNIEYVGFAGKEKRKNLMAHAKALFLPTLYLEPFGYVVIEANMSGTPVITSPFGAFVETVKDGYNGYKCWTHREFVEAARNIENIKPSDCREWAMQYTLDKTAPMYKRYFTQILGLIGKGWYS